MMRRMSADREILTVEAHWSKRTGVDRTMARVQCLWSSHPAVTRRRRGTRCRRPPFLTLFVHKLRQQYK
eukprot:scaffold1242_cov123-Isochrysis_galbana.AAC.11